MLSDRFRIVALLGKMGEVYRAEDLKLGQQVALKFLPHAGEAKLERLYSEVRLAAYAFWVSLPRSRRSGWRCSRRSRRAGVPPAAAARLARALSRRARRPTTAAETAALPYNGCVRLGPGCFYSLL